MGSAIAARRATAPQMPNAAPPFRENLVVTRATRLRHQERAGVEHRSTSPSEACSSSIMLGMAFSTIVRSPSYTGTKTFLSRFGRDAMSAQTVKQRHFPMRYGDARPDKATPA